MSPLNLSAHHAQILIGDFNSAYESILETVTAVIGQPALRHPDVWVEFFPAFDRIPDQSFRRNKLCVHQVRPVILAYGTERGITDILHGSQKQREFRKLYVANFYHSVGIYLFLPEGLKG